MPAAGHHTTSLSAASLKALNGLVLELNDPRQSEEQLFARLVARCQTLIPHSRIIVSCTDRQMKLPASYFGPWTELAAAVTPAFQRHVADHPRFFDHIFSSALVADAVFGHVSQRCWNFNGMFDEAFKVANPEDEIVVSLPFNERLTISLVVSRDGQAFTREERDLLALLAPHVAQAWRTNALIRRLEEADAQAKSGFQVVADSRGNVVETSDEAALRGLWERFRDPRRQDTCWELPGVARDWLKEKLAAHFQRGETSPRGRLSGELQSPAGERLRIRLAPGTPYGLHVLAFERAEPAEAAGARRLESLGLTRRQAQVLYWLASGKTNEEIAGILGIRLFTVKNHLKVIYVRLAVENRHAASVSAWRLLSGEENVF